MSLEKQIRELVSEELQAAIAPLAAAVADLQNRDIGAQLAEFFQGRSPKRGPGRPPAVAGARERPGRACAVIGCKRPHRSKGYCAAHYQKFRSLARTRRLPADWKPNAAPRSVKDIMLPRGRAGAKALAALRAAK
jgi:hypothetical protein